MASKVIPRRPVPRPAAGKRPVERPDKPDRLSRFLFGLMVAIAGFGFGFAIAELSFIKMLLYAGFGFGAWNWMRR